MADSSVTVHSVDALRLMSYGKLQRLAKSLGIKANLKKDKLIQDILEKNTSNKSVDQAHNDQSVNNVDTSSPVNVTTEIKVTVEKNDVPQRRHVRKGTYDKEKSEMGALTPNISSKKEEHVNRIQRQVQFKKIAALPQRIRKKSEADSGKIPRPERVLKEASITKRPVRATPNFARLHKKIFDNMDSLDDYILKKQARVITLQLGGTPKSMQDKSNNRKSKVSPPKARSDTAPVLSLKNVNFNFSEIPKPQEVKPTQSKIPVRVSNVKLNFKKENRPSHKQLYKKNNLVDSEKSRVHRREIVTGVRTNRRFELQMKSRLISVAK